VSSAHTLDDHIRLMPTPGHTPDHFSGVTGRRWVPTFPRARYLFAKQEFAYWSAGGLVDAVGVSGMAGAGAEGGWPSGLAAWSIHERMGLHHRSRNGAGNP
jgi:hypothetical protein